MAQGAVAGESRGSAGSAELAKALREISDEHESVIGGLLVAATGAPSLVAEARVARKELVAVMSATVAGVVTDIVEQVGAGRHTGCLFEGTLGHVAVYPLKKNMVLVMVSRGEVTSGRFAVTAKKILPRLREVAADVGAGATRGPARTSRSPLPVPIALEDLPRIDLSSVSTRRTEPT